MQSPQIAFGYHGCDASVVQTVLNGGDINPSVNAYDWLGHGIYFWERSAARAMKWASELAHAPHSSVQKPAVLGAVIDLGHCLDLADPDSAESVSIAYHDFLRRCHEAGDTPPKNKGSESKARFLDCAVINHLHHLRESVGEPAYDSVRGFFNEGKAVYPTAGLRTLDHVQICIRNPRCITGYFRPKLR